MLQGFRVDGSYSGLWKGYALRIEIRGGDLPEIEALGGVCVVAEFDSDIWLRILQREQCHTLLLCHLLDLLDARVWHLCLWPYSSILISSRECIH